MGEQQDGKGEVGRGKGGAVASRGRSGIALVAMLITIILLSILSLASARIVSGDFRRVRDVRTIAAAANAADAGAYGVVRDWARIPHEGLAVGAMLGPDSTIVAGARAVTSTMRTAPAFFWTTSTGEAGDSVSRTRARRTVGVAFRLAIPDIVIDAALTVRDSLTLAGGALVSGSDSALAGWGASCAAGAPVAAVAMSDTTRLCDGACGSGSVSGRALGTPSLLSDTTAADSLRYLRFGGETWSTLTAHAAAVLASGAIVTPGPSLTSGVCDRTRADNWGDPQNPLAPCGLYAPLIWARGDVEIRGGVGQGVLIADGDVTLSAGALFAGVIIARDDLLSLGIGGTVLGAVLAGDARTGSGDHSTLGGATRLQRSACAIQQALERSSRIIPVSRRSWGILR